MRPCLESLSSIVDSSIPRVAAAVSSLSREDCCRISSGRCRGELDFLLGQAERHLIGRYLLDTERLECQIVSAGIVAECAARRTTGSSVFRSNEMSRDFKSNFPGPIDAPFLGRINAASSEGFGEPSRTLSVQVRGEAPANAGATLK